MQFQRVNRSNAERGIGVFENRSGATISGNYPVAFTTGSSSNDGYHAVVPATGSLATFAGICDADTADANPGLYQCYGYRDSVRIFATGSSQTIGAGVILGPANGSNGLNSTGIQTILGPVIAMEAIGAAVNSPGGYAKAFIRAL